MRSPTDRSKSNHRSPKEQPLQVRPLTANPAQSSPARHSLTSFATGSLPRQDRPKLQSLRNHHCPQKPTRNAKADYTADSTPADILRWFLKSQAQHCPRCEMAPAANKKRQSRLYDRLNAHRQPAMDSQNSSPTLPQVQPKVNKPTRSSCDHTASLREDQAQWAKDGSLSGHLATTLLRSQGTKHSGPRIKRHLESEDPERRHSHEHGKAKREAYTSGRKHSGSAYTGTYPAPCSPTAVRSDAHAARAAVLHCRVWDKGW
jgi:hypothetical protein